MGSSGWEALWSGLIGGIPGALIAALVSALVAVYILNRSNEQQRAHAADAVEAQRARDAEAAKVARKHHEEVLAVQRDSLMTDLAARRDEAARQREYAAIAEISATTQGFVFAKTSGELDQAHAAFDMACMKFSLEMGFFPVKLQMVAWPIKLHQVSEDFVFDRTLENLEARNGAIAKVRTFCMNWSETREKDVDVLVATVEGLFPGPVDLRPPRFE